MEATQVCINRWMDKEDVVYIYIYTMEYDSPIHKKEWKFAICNNKAGLGGHYAKWNKSDRERQILYDITYMWNLKNKTSEYNKKEADSQI